jgi:hypothetical protein
MLFKRFILILAALPALAADITWTNLGNNLVNMPGMNGWLGLPYDPIGRQYVHYGIAGNSVSIYSTDIKLFNPVTSAFSQSIVGNGALTNQCIASTATMPTARHPSWMMATDTKRHVFWFTGGVNASAGNCTQTDFRYMWKLDLNTLTISRTLPNTAAIAYYGAMVYDSAHDVLFMFGSDIGAQTHDHWIYCPSDAESAAPEQIAAGCTRVNDWIEVDPPVVPQGVWLNAMFYDPSEGLTYTFGGITGGGIQREEVYSFNAATQTWTQRASLPAVDTTNYYPQVSSDMNGKFYYHQATGTGAPSDWLYTTISNSWVRLTSAGLGPQNFAACGAVDINTQAFYCWSRDPYTWLPVMWKGQLPTAPPPPPVISEISSAPVETIHWDTSTASDTQVAYGLTASYGTLTPLQPALVTEHTAQLGPLEASKTYHYQVLSRDASGQLVVSTDRTFTTGN